MPELLLESADPIRVGADHIDGMVGLDSMGGLDRMNGAVADGLDRIGLALADPIRREVLVRLLDGSQCPSDLAEAIGTSRSNLSNHLACLRGCGLISAERAGRHLHYHLVSAPLAAALRALVGVAVTLPACEEGAP